MIPYFPLHPSAYAMTMGTQALNPDRVIEVDSSSYSAEIALKEEILARDFRYYFQASPTTEAMQWDALAYLLPNMARHDPQYFTLNTQGDYWTWHNRLTKTTVAFRLGDSVSLPQPPLAWLGCQAQEDVLLLDGTDPVVPLVAGLLCFANGWCLDEKMGQPILAIHGPVPLFAEQIGRSAQALMERLKINRPVVRVNWAVTPTAQLDLASCFMPQVRMAAEAITAANAGDTCYFRIERQILTRLPHTQAILFTIHTYRCRIADLTPIQKRTLLAVLGSAPPNLLAYKGIAPFASPLLAYLRAKESEGLF